MSKKNRPSLANLSKRDRGSMSSTLKIGGAVVAVIAVIVLLMVVSNLQIFDTPPEQSETLSPSPSITIEETQRSLSGKTIEEDQADVAATVQVLLTSTNAVNAEEEGSDPESILQQLDDGDYTSFAEDEFFSHLHIPPYLEDEEDAMRITAQGLYSIAAFSSVYGGGVITPVSAEALVAIPVDQEFGIAQVPVATFTGEDSDLHLMMVHTEDGWKLDVYSFVLTVQLTASTNETNEITTEP